MKNTYKQNKLWALCMLSTLCLGAPAHAQSNPLTDYVPTAPQSHTQQSDQNAPLLRLTPDKLELIQLEKSATSVFVGNPDHLNVLLDTPTTLVLVPKKPGSTFFQVLDADGETIIKRHAIIASPSKDYVRIRNTCALGGEDVECKKYDVFYCPDMCHEVGIIADTESDIPEEMPEQASGTGTEPSQPSTDFQVEGDNGAEDGSNP